MRVQLPRVLVLGCSLTLALSSLSACGSEAVQDEHSIDPSRTLRHGEGLKEAQRDAAVAIRSLPGGSSVSEVSRLSRILKKYSRDSRFCEDFALRLGAGETLKTWATLVGNPFLSSEGKEELADLQKHLGITLATATRSTSPAMQKWKEEVIALGGERVGFLGSPPVTGASRPYGFQVISSLMRHGVYGEEFLRDYGARLLEFDRSHPSFGPERLWRPYGTKLVVSLTDPDSGLDPVTGYLSALARNPRAAVNAFYSEKWEESATRDATLLYLLQERDWPKESRTGAEQDLTVGYVELGHALETATLGVPYDEIGLRRQRQNVNVMQQIMSLTHDNLAFFESKPEVLPSMAKIGAGYVDSLNWMLANRFMSQESSAGNFTSAPGEHSADWSLVRDFLRAVARDGESHRKLVAAQIAYLTSLVERPHSGKVDIGLTLDVGAYHLGMIDYALLQNLRSSAEEHNSGEPILFDSDDARILLGRESVWQNTVFRQTPTASETATLSFDATRSVKRSTITIPVASDITPTTLTAYTDRDATRKNNPPREGNFPDWKEVKEEAEFPGLLRATDIAREYIDRAMMSDGQAGDLRTNTHGAYLDAWPTTWDD